MFRLLELFLIIGSVVTRHSVHIPQSYSLRTSNAYCVSHADSTSVSAGGEGFGNVGVNESSSKRVGDEYMMGVVILVVPVAVLAWFPFLSKFQTRLLFNQAFSQGLQIQRILAGGKKQKQK
ncbi:hypothetical protein Vadar_022769 [Vaccinium darrowii]|uniref:Uncharacterized protein n=1 Tax=Vaccinium darrowii TaxID=229202 RepID=A0ACB7Y9Q3_9ERIC|nr:hypothetical protein Vadar_022769 [Vaccinium darrowii]